MLGLTRVISRSRISVLCLNTKNPRSNRVRVFIAMLVVLLATACSTNNLSTKMASWQGSHIDAISAAWGSPDECTQRDGREFCTWTKAPASQYTSLSSETFIARPICVRTVEFDDSGTMIGWRWRGDRCSNSSSEVLARTSPNRPEQLATGGEQSPNLELAVTEPEAKPAITHTQ